MPGISDPGSALVAAARAAGVSVEVLPGPSAAMGVALLSGFPLQRFSFEGYPPRTSGERRARFSQALRAGTTTIWYESPRRIRAALSDLSAVAPEARIFVMREYTKRHEQHFSGTVKRVAAELPNPVMGEVAFAVAPYQVAAAVPTTEATSAAIDALLERGTRVGEVAKLLAARGFGERQQLYARVVERKARRKTPIKQG
jgi:16S rRNA (cytidine1402-2'-O)-methyltransferase